MIDVDDAVDVVLVLIARRIVADAVAFRVRGLLLVFVFINVDVAAGNLIEGKDIRIFRRVVTGRRDHERAVVLVKQQLFVRTE